MPILFVLSGPDIGRTFELGDGAVLGRSPECEAPLRGASVSRRHARLEARGDDWFLVDLGSRNGIRRGELRERELRLTDGGTLSVGDVELRFRLEEAGVREAPPARAAAPAPAAPAPAPEVEELDLEEAEEEPDGLVFEGEELFDAPPPATATPAPAAARREPEPAAPAPVAGTAARDRAAERLARAGIRTRPGTDGGPVQDSARPVLQYSRHASGGGALSADLAQYPGWVKALVGLLVVGLFVGLFWLAFRLAGSLGSRSLDGGEPVLESTGE
jgi:predicted component of type VI protein secretion system